MSAHEGEAPLDTSGEHFRMLCLGRWILSCYTTKEALKAFLDRVERRAARSGGAEAGRAKRAAFRAAAVAARDHAREERRRTERAESAAPVAFVPVAAANDEGAAFALASPERELSADEAHEARKRELALARERYARLAGGRS